MKLQAVLFIVSFFSSGAILNHNPQKPGCPVVVNPMENFVSEWITGDWFEIQRLPTAFQRGTCGSVSIVINIARNISTIQIRHEYRANNNLRIYDQVATYSNSKFRSVWSVKVQGSLTTNIDGHLYIIDTNYNNYAVVFACGLVNNNASTHGVWIFGRNRTLQPEFINKSLNALKMSKIVTRPLMVTNQIDCTATTTKAPVDNENIPPLN